MSPSEADLRAALRAGEGDDLDVERVVAGGRAERAQRRVRVLTTAAVTVVVAGVGAGAALVNSGGDSSRAGGGTSGGYRQDLDGARTAGPGSSATPPAGTVPTPASGHKAPAAACPTSLPDYRLPGGGSPGQFGSDGPMLRRAVASITVCAYGAPGSAGTAPRSLVLTGDAARTIAASLEDAPRTKATGACPFYRTADARSLAIIGLAADGAQVGIVTTTVGVPASPDR